MLRQVCQQLQGTAHPEDALLAIICEWEIDQQRQPRAQEALAPATGCKSGFASPRFGCWHRRESLKKITLKIMKHMKLLESCRESCRNMGFFYTIKESIEALRRAAGVLGWYLLQDPSAVSGHGEVSQEREGQLLNSAVIRGDSWRQLHHRVHQRVAKQCFRAHCRSRATVAKSTASWKQNRDQILGLGFKLNSLKCCCHVFHTAQSQPEVLTGQRADQHWRSHSKVWFLKWTWCLSLEHTEGVLKKSSLRQPVEGITDWPFSKKTSITKCKGVVYQLLIASKSDGYK